MLEVGVVCGVATGMGWAYLTACCSCCSGRGFSGGDEGREVEYFFVLGEIGSVLCRAVYSTGTNSIVSSLLAKQDDILDSYALRTAWWVFGCA